MVEVLKKVRKGWSSTPYDSSDPDTPYKPDFSLIHTNYINVREEPNAKKITYAFDRENIRKVKREEEFLIVGFDTEYKTPKESVNNKEIKERKARYEVLSYQFHAKTKDGIEWNGIILPDELERVSFSDFIVYVVGKGIQDKIIETIPNQIYLVAHYNRADIPAFDDKDELIKRLNNVRKSLVTRDLPIKLKIKYFEDEVINPDPSIDDESLNIYLRDTILLAPTGQKSLAELGELVDCPKVVLSADKKEEINIKENLDVLIKENWELFKRYALIDAEICVRYFDRITANYEELMGTRRIPSALSNIGIKLLLKEWSSRDVAIERLHAIGKESFAETVWKREKQQFITTKKDIYYEEISWFIDFVTETYHGGRNEQFWVGPSYIADWSDYDLTGAYPTAMAMIGQPLWKEIYSSTNESDYTPTTLGFACLDFKFKKSIRYPTFPVRTNNGIIFPRSGRSYCSAPEIALALQLGCEITIRHGVIIPQDHSNKIFFPFLKQTIQQRQNATTELEKAFWKEITNSCYGKTAQGLRRKRVFNIQREAGQQLPESQITNPYYASYITSFVRACVGEIINAIPSHKMIFSVTTDGFITDASDEEIAKASNGIISSHFSKSRIELSGSGDVLSKKHNVRQVLGWKTRGQATIIRGDGNEKDRKNYVLAKAGIQTSPSIREIYEQNIDIVKLFFTRTGTTERPVDVHTSLRDMIFYHADLVNKTSIRRLNMEYDFKRRPKSVADKTVNFEGIEYSHLILNTTAWETIEEFKSFRSMFDNYIKNNIKKKRIKTENGETDNVYQCLKTKDDFQKLADYYDTRNSLPINARSYLPLTNNADVRRLKRDICRAFKQRQAGLDNYQHLTANEFIGHLRECGFTDLNIKLARADIENAGRNEFEANTTPRTKAVLIILKRIKNAFPKFESDAILSNYENEISFNDVIKNKRDPFLKRTFKL